MKQYQISLDAKSFGVLDELEGILKIPKTTIIQQSLIKFKRQFSQALLSQKAHRKQMPIMDSLIGSIHIEGKKKVNYSQRSDSSYLQD